MRQNQRKTTTLPGVWATLAAGFDLTAKHLWLLFLPVLLDLFYWLGPRLRFDAVVNQALAALPPDMALPELTTQMADLAARTNLFTTLTVQLVGVPALMVGVSPEQAPLAPPIWSLASWSETLGLFVAFTVLGLLLTAVYYTLVAYAVAQQRKGAPQWGAWSQRIGRNWLRLLGLTLLFVLNALMIYLPLMFVGALFSLVSGVLGMLVLLMGPVLLLWLVIFLCFAPAGIVMNGRSVLRAIVESAQLVRINLWPTLTLLLTIFLAGLLLDWLLLLADMGTWLTLVNIVGHAFVSTALLAALFIFYRDRYQVLQRAQMVQAAVAAEEQSL